MRKALFNIFCLSWIVIFICLGCWQVKRLHWKEGLIAQVQKYENSPPVEFQIKDYDANKDLFKKVFLNGRFLHDQEILLAAKYLNSDQNKNELGYHVITPFLTTEGVVIFVNRGWVPVQYKTAQQRPDSLYEPNAEGHIEGMIRENHGKAPWYMPHNQPEKDVWYWIDLPEMSKRLEEKSGLKNIQPVLIQQTNLTTYKDFKYPVPIASHLEFYNQHMTYIITWFSLAVVTLIMWIIYNKKK